MPTDEDREPAPRPAGAAPVEGLPPEGLPPEGLLPEGVTPEARQAAEDATPLIGNTPDGLADGAIRPGREQPDGLDG